MIVQSFSFFDVSLIYAQHFEWRLGLFMRVYDGSIHIVFGYFFWPFFVYYEGM